MMKNLGLLLFAGIIFSFSSCSTFKIKRGRPIWRENLTQGRIVDVLVVKKNVGYSGLAFLRQARFTHFLEGYITGHIADFDGRAVEGVVVRAIISGGVVQKTEQEAEPQAEALEAAAKNQTQSAPAQPNFDAGISDQAGLYRLRFSLPIVKGKVDIKGKLLFNPGYKQQYELLGQSYEPQVIDSEFRLFYDANSQFIVFTEAPKPLLVRPLKNPNVLPAAPTAETRRAASIEVKPKQKVQEKPAPSGNQKNEKKAANNKTNSKEKTGDEFFKGFDFE